VIVEALVTTAFVIETPSSPAVVPMQVAPVAATVAPDSNPAPVIVIAVLVRVVTTGTAEGLTSWMPYSIVRAPVSVAEPPSVLATVTVNVPAVAAAFVFGLVGVTLKTIDVALTDVTVAVTGVAFTVDANVTVAPVANPEPVIVTVFAPEPSKIAVGEMEVITGAALIVNEAVLDAVVELSSVRVAVHVPAAVPASAKSAVAVVAEVSTAEVQVTVLLPVQVEAIVTAPPSLMNPVPVKVAVPEAPAPKLFVVAP
jgi:hypothetical protein